MTDDNDSKRLGNMGEGALLDALRRGVSTGRVTLPPAPAPRTPYGDEKRFDHLLEAMKYASEMRAATGPSLRRTGRTARLLQVAAELATDRGDVLVLVHRPDFDRIIWGMLLDLGYQEVAEGGKRWERFRVRVPFKGATLSVIAESRFMDFRRQFGPSYHVILDHVARGEP